MIPDEHNKRVLLIGWPGDVYVHAEPGAFVRGTCNGETRYVMTSGAPGDLVRQEWLTPKEIEAQKKQREAIVTN